MELAMEPTPDQLLRIAARERPRFSSFSEVKLPSLPDVPGMISEAEGRYLFWLTSQTYTGRGAVVEIGTWLGRSTIHLAAGLRETGHLDALHCFDQFLWRHAHGLKARLPLRTGDDFQPYFEANVQPVYPLVRTTKTAIRDLTWAGGPIEILFLDAPKTLSDLSSVFAVLGPSLVPGLSLIAFQDYQHFPSYPVPAVVSCLQDHLDLVHVIEGGGSVSFKVKKALTFDRAQPIDWNFARWNPEKAAERWRQILAQLPPEARARVEPGLAFLLHESCGEKIACAALGKMSLDREKRSVWQPYTVFPFYDRYKALFRAANVRPRRGDRSAFASLRWRVRRVRAGVIRPLKLAAVQWARAAGHLLSRH